MTHDLAAPAWQSDKIERRGEMRPGVRLHYNVFGLGIEALLANFGRGEPSPALAATFYQHLRHLTDEQFNRAVDWCIKHETFWPSVAVMLAHTDTDPTIIHHAASGAWFGALAAITKYGAARDVPRDVSYRLYEDPRRRAALDAVGGLEGIAAKGNDDKTRKRFEAAFTAEMTKTPGRV